MRLKSSLPQYPDGRDPDAWESKTETRVGNGEYDAYNYNGQKASDMSPIASNRVVPTLESPSTA